MQDKQKGQAELQQEKEREKKPKGSSPKSKAQDKKKAAREEGALQWETSGSPKIRRWRTKSAESNDAACLGLEFRFAMSASPILGVNEPRYRAVWIYKSCAI